MAEKFLVEHGLIDEKKVENLLHIIYVELYNNKINVFSLGRAYFEKMGKREKKAIGFSIYYKIYHNINIFLKFFFILFFKANSIFF
jgi:hypothetical protein